MMRTKLSRSLAICAAMALALALAGCDNGVSPGGGGGGSADFGNPFHGTWTRTQPAGGEFNLTITATSATTGEWIATGVSTPGGSGGYGTFIWRGSPHSTADVTGSFRVATVWVHSGGGQTLTWGFGTPVGSSFPSSETFVRTTP